MNIGQLFETHLGMAARGLGMKVAALHLMAFQLENSRVTKSKLDYLKTASSSYLMVELAKPLKNEPLLAHVHD